MQHLCDATTGGAAARVVTEQYRGLSGDPVRGHLACASAFARSSGGLRESTL